VVQGHAVPGAAVGLGLSVGVSTVAVCK
jgi:hypothetical protein